MQSGRRIYSVSELTAHIKRLLEDQFPMVWISGEISNLKVPSSGHAYFTLKDKQAQMAAVMFRGQLRQLKFALDDGISLVGLGRVTVYEPRGSYQIILEYAEPMGVGALQVAFEQLKQKLLEEGLFSDAHKSPLPFLPERPGIITSPTGAVVQDIIKIARRRFPGMAMDVYPVRVQGAEAAEQIVAAIKAANRLARNDVLVLARGGGSLEDLASFNSERVARAIFASRIPIVSAVGHETDFSIADFVADLRAPTPSAAAEIVVPIKSELTHRCMELSGRIHRALRNTIQRNRDRLAQCRRMLIHPGKKVQDQKLHLDQLTQRLKRSLDMQARHQRSRLEQTRARLSNRNPDKMVATYNVKLELLRNKLLQSINIITSRNNEKVKAALAVLRAVDPHSVLNRGYSITRTVPHGRVVTDARTVHGGQPLEIRLAKGQIAVIVQEDTNSTIEE
ncbi:MAG: exodeoxyribonuclease VII large subunit [Desulfobacteraceae bacterium]|jgi:exodeoxyribonuclease VII large subunit